MIIILIIFIIILIAIPIVLSLMVYKFIKKKSLDKRLRLISLIPILVVVYLVFGAIYPSNEFYKTNFKEVTNYEFPKNGIIRYKTASYPDTFGDFTSCFLVEFDETDLKKLEKNLINNSFVKVINNSSTEELTYIEGKINNKKYISEYSKEIKGDKHYSVGFLNDNKSVIITRVSW